MPRRGYITKHLMREFNADELDGMKRSLGINLGLVRTAASTLPEIVRLRKEGRTLVGIGSCLTTSAPIWPSAQLR